MDVDDVETLTVNALGGADKVTVNDLAATDVESVDIDLGVAGVGDLAVDAVTVNATNSANVVRISGASGGVSVVSPYLAVGIVDSEPANDALDVNASTGADLVSASTLASTSVLPHAERQHRRRHPGWEPGWRHDQRRVGQRPHLGGDGNDTIDGGADTDTIDGGAGIDAAVNGENVTNVP